MRPKAYRVSDRKSKAVPGPASRVVADPGAGAVVLGAGKEPGVIGAELAAYGEYHDALGIYSGGTFKPATAAQVAEEGPPTVRFVRRFPATFNTERWPCLVRGLLERHDVIADDVAATESTCCLSARWPAARARRRSTAPAMPTSNGAGLLICATASRCTSATTSQPPCATTHPESGAERSTELPRCEGYPPDVQISCRSGGKREASRSQLRSVGAS